MAALPTTPTTERLIIIALDPGHGGEDPGAIGPGGTKEKDVVLKLAHLLRERINDIAAEVAKLALTLEGPDSPIEAILVSDEQKPAISTIVKTTTVNGAAAANGVAANGASTEARGTLAERIRALQAHASRARQPG